MSRPPMPAPTSATASGGNVCCPDFASSEAPLMRTGADPSPSQVSSTPHFPWLFCDCAHPLSQTRLHSHTCAMCVRVCVCLCTCVHVLAFCCHQTSQSCTSSKTHAPSNDKEVRGCTSRLCFQCVPTMPACSWVTLHLHTFGSRMSSQRFFFLSFFQHPFLWCHGYHPLYLL